MRLSVVIPTWNEAENLPACLESARRLAADVEVVVADGGSTDETRVVAERFGAAVIDAPRGRGRQLRAGVEASTGEIVLMLHADTRLDPSAAGQLGAACVDSEAVLGAFRQRIDAVGLVYRWIERGNAWRVRWLGLPYGDQAIFVSRRLLDEVGGVPPLPLMEDVALMQRLRRRAWPVLLDGPLLVSARRWRRNGAVRQTLRNWMLLSAFTLGVPAARLASLYEPHRNGRVAANAEVS